MQETHSLALSSVLAQTREEQGLSLQQVAEKLNLPIEQIESFESDTLELSQLNTFERGYLKNYAGLLEIDLQDFSALQSPSEGFESRIQLTQDYNDYADETLVKGSAFLKTIFYLIIVALIAYGLYIIWPGGADVAQVAEEALNLQLEIPVATDGQESSED